MSGQKNNLNVLCYIDQEKNFRWQTKTHLKYKE